jgi:hypothetical protein
MFAVAAIGSMMALAGEGRAEREGTRMGLWGAAQAIAAGFGGLVGAALADAMRTFMTDPSAFGTVFHPRGHALPRLRLHGGPHHGPRSNPPRHRRRCSGRMTMLYDVVVVGVAPPVQPLPKTSPGRGTRWR